MPKLTPPENVKHLMAQPHGDLVTRLYCHIAPTTAFLYTGGCTNLHRLNKYTLAVLITLLRDAP